MDHKDNSGQLDRTKVSFAQAEGVEALPTQLRPREVTSRLRAQLWHVIHYFLEHGIANDTIYNSVPRMDRQWTSMMRAWHVHKLNALIDEYDNRADTIISYFKRIITQGNYVQVFDLIQFVLRDENCPADFGEYVNVALENAMAAYRVVDQTIVQYTTEAEANIIVSAFTDLKKAGYHGALKHLSSAGSSLTEGAFADSVRESIHAVEAVAKILSPGAATLAPAMVKLAANQHIHPALKEAAIKLYAYSSDEKGIRHPLLESGDA